MYIKGLSMELSHKGTWYQWNYWNIIRVMIDLYKASYFFQVTGVLKTPFKELIKFVESLHTKNLLFTSIKIKHWQIMNWWVTSVFCVLKCEMLYCLFKPEDKMRPDMWFCTILMFSMASTIDPISVHFNEFYLFLNWSRLSVLNKIVKTLFGTKNIKNVQNMF